MKRPAGALAVAAAILALTGCTLPGASSVPEDEPSSCGQCRTEVAALRAQVEGMPGVSQVGQFRYNSDTNAGGGPSLSIDLSLDGEVEATVDSIFEAAWKSRVTPLETVVVVNAAEPGAVKAYDARFYATFRQGYEDRWGPRPVS